LAAQAFGLAIRSGKRRPAINGNEQGAQAPVSERLQDMLLVLALVVVTLFLVALVWLHGPDAQMATMPGM
jgi:hypothetical protein